MTVRRPVDAPSAPARCGRSGELAAAGATVPPGVVVADAGYWHLDGVDPFSVVSQAAEIDWSCRSFPRFQARQCPSSRVPLCAREATAATPAGPRGLETRRFVRRARLQSRRLCIRPIGEDKRVPAMAFRARTRDPAIWATCYRSSSIAVLLNTSGAAQGRPASRGARCTVWRAGRRRGGRSRLPARAAVAPSRQRSRRRDRRRILSRCGVPAPHRAELRRYVRDSAERVASATRAASRYRRLA